MGDFTWTCSQCHRTKLYDKNTQDKGFWTCASCQDAALPSSPSVGKAPEPAVTSISKPNTDTPMSLKYNKHEAESLAMMNGLLQSVPHNALITLLEAVGGSLVMDMQEAIEPHPEKIILCQWVQRALPDRPGLITRLEITLTEKPA